MLSLFDELYSEIPKSCKYTSPLLKIYPVAILLTFILSAVSGQSLHRVTISGRVLNDSTQTPISNANVFIANSRLGSCTDEKGEFTIDNVPAGSLDLVVSHVGFVSTSVRIAVVAKTIRDIKIRLRPRSVELQEYVVTGQDPKEWKSNLEKFKKLLLGTTANADKCSFLNAEVLSFSMDSTGKFQAYAESLVSIKNNALGYRLEVLLGKFVLDNRILTFDGKVKFNELTSFDTREKEQWERNRLKAYRGSLRHFLGSLFKHDLRKEGFRICSVKDLFGKFMNCLPIEEDDILSMGGKSYEGILRFNNFLEVEYIREDAEHGFNLLRKKGVQGQVSWIILNYGFVTLLENGFINEQFPVKMHGYWAWERLADAIPIDFTPQDVESP